MSAWGDMMRRGAGEEIRTEDIHRYITLDKIEKMLKEMKVGPTDYPPMYMFKVVIEGFDGIQTFSISALATMQQDGTKSFYNENVLDSFKSLMEKGGIIEIGNLFV